MSYKKPVFTTGEIYHIYNRGVEKRTTFLESADYLRMIIDLYNMNDENSVINSQYYIEVEPRYFQSPETRVPIVEILAFVLMPNHYHLLLRQIGDNGIIKFMQKLGTAYAMYFNKKNDRVGPLFQGRFKAVHVSEEKHLLHLPFYIHSNPIILMDENYRGSTSIIEFLEQYRWSSFPDYIGKNNFPLVTSREFLTEIIGDEKTFQQAMLNWLTEKEENMAEISNKIIEVEPR